MKINNNNFKIRQLWQHLMWHYKSQIRREFIAFISFVFRTERIVISTRGKKYMSRSSKGRKLRMRLLWNNAICISCYFLKKTGFVKLCHVCSCKDKKSPNRKLNSNSGYVPLYRLHKYSYFEFTFKIRSWQVCLIFQLLSNTLSLYGVSPTFSIKPALRNITSSKRKISI